MKVLAINPGSTSTKVALFEDGKEVWSRRYPFLRPPEMQQLTLDFDRLGIAHARDVHFTIEVAEA